VVECLRGDEAVEAIEDAAVVEDASWKADRGTRRFAPGAPRELLRQALAGLAPSGEMELGLARAEGKPVAFLLNFLTEEQVWYYQGAYDEEYRKLYPGMVLHFRCIERAFQEGRRVYDFLSGAEPYKLNWTTESRTLRYQALFPNTPRGHAAFSLLVAPRWGLRESPHARAAHGVLKQLRQDPGAVARAVRERLRIPTRPAEAPLEA
jgi:CelD/BcsL family acetyltransferase involved in cellulose biosynthesis